MADRLEGRTFGDFRVDALVGRGAVGKVYAATQLSLKRRVTLKVLDAGLFTPDEFKTQACQACHDANRPARQAESQLRETLSK